MVGEHAFLHVASPELARAALAAQPAKAPLYAAFTGFVGAGLFTAEGATWRAKRAATVRALSAYGGTAAVEAAFNDELTTLLCALRTAGGGVLDLLPLLQRATLRAMYRYLAGRPLRCGAAAEDAYLAAATVLRATLPARARSLWAAAPDGLYRRWSALGRGEAAATTAAHALAVLAVAEAAPGSPLGLLAAARSVDGIAPWDALHDAATLLFAGHDTTAATLAWTCLRLAQHPQHTARLRRHLSAALPSPGPATAAQAGRVPLLEATLREVLRLHPPAPLVVRPLARALPIAVPGCPLAHLRPTRAAAAVWLHAVHRDAAAWGADADAFVPQRWLRPAEPAAAFPGLEADPWDAWAVEEGAGGGAYMPFAAGPRSCVGAAVAQTALRVSLARLVLGVELSSEGALDLHPSVGFTVTPAAGVRLRVRTLGDT